MKTYLRLLAYAKPFPKIVIPFFGFTLIAVFFNVFQFTLLIPLLNFLFDPMTSDEARRYAALPEFTFSAGYAKDLFYHKVFYFKTINPIYALYFIAAVIVAAVILGNFFRYMAQRTMVKARTYLVKRLREAL